MKHNLSEWYPYTNLSNQPTPSHPFLALESAKNLEALDPNMQFGRGGGALGGINDFDTASSKRASATALSQSKDGGGGYQKGGSEVKANQWSMSEGWEQMNI